MAADDYEDLPNAAWAKLTQAANDPTHLLRLMALATVTPDGRPSNRTLVLRGADQALETAWFHTDKRSPKMIHLAHVPYVSAIGYDERAHIQIRLEGKVTLHHDDALANQHWEQASLAVRHAYSLPIGPGEPLVQHDPRARTMRTDHTAGESDRGRVNFVVIQLQVESIDWLQLLAAGQIRAVMRRGRGWKPEPLAP